MTWSWVRSAYEYGGGERSARVSGTVSEDVFMETSMTEDVEMLNPSEDEIPGGIWSRRAFPGMPSDAQSDCAMGTAGPPESGDMAKDEEAENGPTGLS